MRNLVASALRHDGYRLLIASSAEEALAVADAHDGPIDLLLTDAIMPGKSGVELANLMTARRPGIPVIIMSGYTEETLDAARPERADRAAAEAVHPARAAAPHQGSARSLNGVRSRCTRGRHAAVAAACTSDRSLRYFGSGASGGLTPAGSGVRVVFITIASMV